jgi:hypothetical protein
LPYDIPVEVPEDLEVRGETNADDSLIQLDDDGQITLTLDKKKLPNLEAFKFKVITLLFIFVIFILALTSKEANSKIQITFNRYVASKD